MARGTHWWNEPPVWAWLLMVVGSVTFAVLLPVALQRTAPVSSSDESATTGSATGSPTSSAASTSPSGSAVPSGSAAASQSSSPAATSPADGTVDLVVLGDGDSAGDRAWPALVADEFDEAELEVSAAAGAGYVAIGAGGETIPEMADDVDLAGADVVVVFGSRNDGSAPTDRVAEAARDLFAAVRESAPDAQLLVIGSPWFTEPAPAGVRANRDAIREAAESAGATFVDPLDEGWFVDRSDLLTASGNPSGNGQLYLAGLIEPLVRDLLPR